MRAFNIHSLSNLEVYNTVLLAIITMLNIGSPQHIHQIIRSLYSLTSSSLWDNPVFPLSLKRLSILHSWFLCQIFINHIQYMKVYFWVFDSVPFIYVYFYASKILFQNYCFVVYSSSSNAFFSVIYTYKSLSECYDQTTAWPAGH